MVISNYPLPQIERPTEEILDDDDNEVLAAFNIILNGYKKAQKRTRAITKAYNELETITLKILKKYHEEKEIWTKNERDKLLVDENNVRIQFSTPKAQDCPRKKSDCDKGDDEIEMIDLTSIFDFDGTQHFEKSTSRDTSPVFGKTNKKRSSEKQTSSRNELSRDNWEENFATDMASTSSRAKRISNKPENIVENQATGNEENRPPFSDKSPNSNDSFSHQNEGARSSAKIGFAKSIYNIEMGKIPNRKSLKQATLFFQPINAKTDLSVSEKSTAKKSDLSRHWGNLFDEDYRTKKINTEPIRGKIKRTNIKDSTKSDQRATLTPEKSEVVSSMLNSNEIKERENESVRKRQISIVIPTASQIDETARSLFDDDDPDDFQASPDILNTCAESSSVMNISTQPIVNDLGIMKNCQEKLPKASQFAGTMASIDETFFAPAEINQPKTDANDRIPLAGCSKIFDVKVSCDNIRTLKRKCNDELMVHADKELEDLALHDINWDAEISNENWAASSKRPINKSFDVPPDKTNKSPEYAHKGKVERNKAKRSKLRGWNCWRCEKYYGNMNLSEDELKKRMDACSRHRSKYNPRYYTPKGFWNPEFPDATDSSDCDENDPSHNRD